MRPMFAACVTSCTVWGVLLALEPRAHAQEGGAVVIEQPTAPPTGEPAPSLRPTLLGLEAGYARASLYAMPIHAFDVALLLGADLGYLSAGAVLEATPGWTREGLDTLGLSAGGFVEGHAGRFRFGGGMRLGRFGVVRATTGPDLATGTGGVFCRVSFDLLPFSDRSALYVVGKASVDDVGTALFGWTAGLGARY